MCPADRGNTLIGDLGGTTARFALTGRADDPRGAPYWGDLALDCSAYPTPRDAIVDYLERAGVGMPGALCLAGAAPVVGHTARFLNSDWTVDAADLAAHFGGAQVHLFNDFEAIAHSIPSLRGDHVEPIGSACPTLPERGDFTVGVIGPGTGLGVGGLLRVDGRLRSLSSEGGHCGFAPETERQFEVLKSLRMTYERVSDERLLSGHGIENIYRALQDRCGLAPANHDAAEIFQLGVDRGEYAAMEAVDMFFEILGQVAGNLALTLGARDGIYVAGGIAGRYPERLKNSRFRAGFENKGRHRDLMARIPTALITHPNPGLLGAAVLAGAIKPA
ncbi:MAG TPA: glucokinase [Burkholderiales bacterium]|nr:glucokinase [Burkholderiales bacterium]